MCNSTHIHNIKFSRKKNIYYCKQSIIIKKRCNQKYNSYKIEFFPQKFTVSSKKAVNFVPKHGIQNVSL